MGHGHQWEQPEGAGDVTTVSPSAHRVQPLGTGRWEGHGGGGDRDAATHTFASGAGQPSGAGLTTGSSLAFLASRAGGALDTSGTLEKEAKG